MTEAIEQKINNLSEELKQLKYKRARIKIQKILNQNDICYLIIPYIFDEEEFYNNIVINIVNKMTMSIAGIFGKIGYGHFRENLNVDFYRYLRDENEDVTLSFANDFEIEKILTDQIKKIDHNWLIYCKEFDITYKIKDDINKNFYVFSNINLCNQEYDFYCYKLIPNKLELLVQILHSKNIYLPYELYKIIKNNF